MEYRAISTRRIHALAVKSQKIKMLNVFDRNIVVHAQRHSVCIVAVNGLNYFQVGYMDGFPASGAAVEPSSYQVCGSMTVSVFTGQMTSVYCSQPYQFSQYVIIQSLDTKAEKLCIAELCVYEPSQCAFALTFVFRKNVVVTCIFFDF